MKIDSGIVMSCSQLARTKDRRTGQNREVELRNEYVVGFWGLNVNETVHILR